MIIQHVSAASETFLSISAGYRDAARREGGRTAVKTCRESSQRAAPSPEGEGIRRVASAESRLARAPAARRRPSTLVGGGSRTLLPLSEAAGFSRRFALPVPWKYVPVEHDRNERRGRSTSFELRAYFEKTHWTS